MESKIKRLERLENGPPIEAIETLLNSIANFFNNEIRITPDYYQTSLMFIGVHAVALTISEAIFGKEKHEGYHFFLEKFVDGDAPDTKFSAISEFLHNWRNILAHQWIGTLGHSIEYDYKMKEGWVKFEDRIKINPRIYCECYLKSFSAGGKIWRYDDLLNEAELEKAKQRIIRKYKQR